MSDLCNLRNTARYRDRRAVYKPTPSTPAAIGERRCPDPKASSPRSTWYIREIPATASRVCTTSMRLKRHAMAGGRLRRTISERRSAAGARSHEAPVSRFRFSASTRQRLRVPQLPSGRNARETAGRRIHQVPGKPQHRQRSCGRKERSDHAQIYRLRPAWRQNTPKPFSALYMVASESIPELPPALRLCHCSGERARQTSGAIRPTSTALPGQNSPDASALERHLNKGVTAQRLEHQASTIRPRGRPPDAGSLQRASGTQPSPAEADSGTIQPWYQA